MVVAERIRLTPPALRLPPTAIRPGRRPDPLVAYRREQEQAAIYLTAFVRKLRPPYKRKSTVSPKSEHKRRVRALMGLVMTLRPKARRGRPPDPEVQRRKAAQALTKLHNLSPQPSSYSSDDEMILTGTWLFGGLSLIEALIAMGTPVEAVAFCRQDGEAPPLETPPRQRQSLKKPVIRITRGTVHRPRAPRRGVWSSFTTKKSYIRPPSSKSFSKDIIDEERRVEKAAPVVIYRLCTEGGLAHHWLVETPQGPDECEDTAKVGAVCKHCKTSREFATVYAEKQTRRLPTLRG
jgi:hypothetical protein